jgi:hypothetical protein
MVKLYGAIHGLQTTRIFFGLFPEERQIELFPSAGLLTKLNALPEGTKIGIEHMSPEDEEEYANFSLKKSFEARLESPVHIEKTSTKYWDHILRHLTKTGKQPVLLDDVNLYKRHIEALIRYHKAKTFRIYHYEHESDLQYSLKLNRRNHSIWAKEMRMRKIHELDRDVALLSKIKETGTQVVIVGDGHAQNWATDPSIPAKAGIVFEDYAIDHPPDIEDLHHPPRMLENVLAKYDPEKYPQEVKNAADTRKTLERRIRLLEKGRLTDRRPDHIGTWCDYNAIEGYFEMFMEKQDGDKVEGTIIDVLGIARFAGKMD